MNSGRTVFAQLLDFLPQYDFRRCVDRYRGNHRTRTFSCYDQLLCMAFAQLTFRESLRDIEACLRAMEPKLYHMGFRGRISRSTLAEANETRDWRIYADFAQVLIAKARTLYAGQSLGLELDHTAYALDATVIDLCLSLFPWAHFRKTKAAVKMHTLLDLRGSIPSFVTITEGRTHDVRALDDLPVEAAAIYVVDRAYMDFKRLYRIHQALAFFVVRAKDNLKYRRITSNKVDKTSGLMLDQTIAVTGFYSVRNYPERLRRVRYYDAINDNVLTFLTNNFTLPALIIADLYRLRWQIELFFKWIKQHLRIKAFYGTSENAVKTQIWIAVIVYVLIAIIKKELAIEASPYTMLQVFSITLFEKTPILQALQGVDNDALEDLSCEQLNLFDF